MTISCLTRNPRNYLYEVVTPPAAYPISLADLKIQTRIDWTSVEHDTFLTKNIIEPVVQCAENLTGISFITRTMKTYRDCFDSFIQIRSAPFDSLVTFKYLNNLDILTSVPSDCYYVVKKEYGNIILNCDSSYPSDLTEKLGGIEIVFTVGFGASSAEVKADLRLAMLQHATFFYENRGDCCNLESCCPPSVRAIYENNRIYNLSGYDIYG